MDIKELIKKYELLKNNGNLNAVAITEIINDLKRLKGSQEVEIPQFVGNYITFAKENGWDIEKAMCHVVDEDGDELRLWFYKDNNMDVFSHAWLDGYKIKKETRYKVRVKGVRDIEGVLTYHKGRKYWTFSGGNEFGPFRTSHTRKELEEAGYSWIFNCEGIEVVKVEE